MRFALAGNLASLPQTAIEEGGSGEVADVETFHTPTERTLPTPNAAAVA